VFDAGALSLAGNRAKPRRGPLDLRPRTAADSIPAKVGLGLLALLVVAAVVLLIAAVV
jgi:hypothetical protein